jgi:hypothetical protein
MRFASQPFLPVSSESNPAELSEPFAHPARQSGPLSLRRLIIRQMSGSPLPYSGDTLSTISAAVETTPGAGVSGPGKCAKALAARQAFAQFLYFTAC